MTATKKRYDNKMSEAKEIIVDNFAGGGGASTGIEMAVGRSVDIAINHDPAAIAMHKTNHPRSEHYTEDIWMVDPVQACRGRPVGLAWFSPDCKHFSKAKGEKPVSKHIRGLSWVILRWAMTVRPRVIMMENVEEIQTWGPLVTDSNGRQKPDPERAGETFQGFIGMPTNGISRDRPALTEACEFLQPDGQQTEALIRGLGYKAEYRTIRACDYGSPTIRKRFFLVARSDGKPIVWPEPTHADPEGLEVAAGTKKPWKSVADVMDFSIPCPSIFATSEEIMQQYGIKAVRPLAEPTMRRIARGIKKFVIDNQRPYIISAEDGGKAAINLIQYHGENSDEARGQRTDMPLMTVDASNRYGLVSTFISKYYSGDNIAAGTDKPLPTVTARDHNAVCAVALTQFNHNSVGEQVSKPINTTTAHANHYGAIYTFLTKYYSGPGDNASSVERPAPTITTKDRMGVVTVYGQDYQITDIGLRMLTPRELFNAQGFPKDYIIDVDSEGKKYPKSEQVARCGNAVCPQIPEALVRANLPEMCKEGQQ